MNTNQSLSLKINNNKGNNEARLANLVDIATKLGSTMRPVSVRTEKENVNALQELTKAESVNLLEHDRDHRMDVDSNEPPPPSQPPHPAPEPLVPSETSVMQAITTLEALLKLNSEVDLPTTVAVSDNPHSKLLKRLTSAARRVALKGIKSKREQRYKIQEMLAQEDEKLATRKGIRAQRGVRAAILRDAFKSQSQSQGQSESTPLPVTLTQSINTSITEAENSSVGSTTTRGTNEDARPSSASASSSSSYCHEFECYVCKSYQRTSHYFYDQMCTSCGDLNYKKRAQTANLDGFVALVTGGRIKIGYETVLILLRAGAHVVVTTRFPHDATFRYSKEPDFQSWNHRLDIYGVDFRFLRMVEAFCVYMNQRYGRLDILIQNAAQTVRRPVQFYKHLLDFEQRSLPIELQGLVKEFGPSFSPAVAVEGSRVPALDSNPNLPVQYFVTATGDTEIIQEAGPALASSSAFSQMCVHPEDSPTPSHSQLFPSDSFDEHHQQLDLRPDNSWTMQLDQVDTSELVEVQLVNSIAPFMLLNKLTPLMAKSRKQPATSCKYGWIIMVSSMEGKFTRTKTTTHPHTNMAKAALNMIVRTSAAYYKSKYSLLMNAVDTGWVTDEDPVPLQGKRPTKFHPPLDEIDGAARVLDPIFQTLNEGKMVSLVYGAFLKDYTLSTW